MIAVFIQQWADEGRVVLDSIDYDVFQVHYLDGMDFVAGVNAALDELGDVRVALTDGSVTFDPGCLQALEDALIAHPTVGLASAFTDGAPFAGPVNPHCCLFREQVLPQIHGLDPRLRCFAWERGLADRLRPWEWGANHVSTASTSTLRHAGRQEALSTHYYDQLADDENARGGS